MGMGKRGELGIEELRVMNYEIRIENYELKVEDFKLEFSPRGAS